MDNLDVKEDLLALLKEGKKILVSWDCGGDQATITTTIDGKELDFNDPTSEQLEIYLLNYLVLPDVGEFSMKGGGEIRLSDEKIIIEYASEVLYIDIAESTLEMMEKKLGTKTTLEKEKKSMADIYTGKKILFKE